MKSTWDRLPCVVSVMALFYGVYLILLRHRFPLVYADAVQHKNRGQ